MSETRHQILKEAEKQLIEGGYSRLNFGDIAETLNVTRQTVYHHFGDKHDLAEAALNHYRREDMRFLHEHARRHAKNFPALFRTVLRGLRSDLSDHNFRGFCACVEVGTQAEVSPSDLREDADAHQRETLSLYAELIRNSQEAGTIRSDLEAERLAREALALQMGIGQMMRIIETERPVDSSARGLAEQWLARIEGPDASSESSETDA
ncbi:TetR/AcrR family transcriptional regulator [Salinibacter grassmerensis]|uniref:TetR/AcrR family transcriptional regulator n=1 Tax=Salinibacter grassmerensis TaxID=3040353 RepID=UPI0021E6E778|nr:TetR/AcrR family transcriptional regulator [Salinibacter grassmerensis]